LCRDCYTQIQKHASDPKTHKARKCMVAASSVSGATDSEKRATQSLIH
jgi:hypothetical protein